MENEQWRDKQNRLDREIFLDSKKSKVSKDRVIQRRYTSNETVDDMLDHTPIYKYRGIR